MGYTRCHFTHGIETRQMGQRRLALSRLFFTATAFDGNAGEMS